SAKMLETQSPINPGDSGGPVVNDNLELVGVVSSLDPRSRLVSLCIDVEEVRAFLATFSKRNRARLQLGAGGGGTGPVTISLTQGAFRQAVCRAIEKIGADDVKAVLPALRTALRDDDPQVRAASASAIAALGPNAKAAVADLLTLCRNPETSAFAE